MRLVSLLCLCVFACALSLQAQHKKAPPKQEGKIEDLLAGEEGAKGLVHGAIPEGDFYVFVHGHRAIGVQRYALLPENEKVRGELKTLKRHQHLTVWGRIVKKETPQQHIVVTKLKQGEVWKPKVSFEYEPAPRIPNLAEHLKNKKDLPCLVHAILKGGRVLVVEYGGWPIMIPVSEKDVQYTKDLWTGDRILIAFSNNREHGKGPLHLSLRTEEDKKPILFLDEERLKDANGKEQKIKGDLTWYPEGPFTEEIFAVTTKDEYGIRRTYFLLADGEEEKRKLFAKCLRHWETEKRGFTGHASSFSHFYLDVIAEGKLIHSQHQGNPALLVKAKDVYVY